MPAETRLQGKLFFEINPKSILSKVGIIAAVSTLLGVILPTYVAWLGGVQGKAGTVSLVERKLTNLSPEGKTRYKYLADALECYRAFESTRAAEIKARREIAHMLSEYPVHAGHDEKLPELLTAREALKKDLLAIPPVSFSGYISTDIILLWPTSYFCLGCLIWILCPPGGSSGSARQFLHSLPLALVLTLFLHSPTWARNFVFYNNGRKLFAVGNYDIWPLGFFMQELMYFVNNWLVATLWWQWIQYYDVRKNELKNDAAERDSTARIVSAYDPSRIDRLSMTYLHWQVTSVFLAGTFLMFSKTYWDFVIVLGDLRYVPHVVLVHSVWAISWTIISLPLVATWYTWKTSRDEVVSRIATDGSIDVKVSEVMLKAAAELQPIGPLNIVATSLVAIISFVLPFFQALVK